MTSSVTVLEAAMQATARMQ